VRRRRREINIRTTIVLYFSLVPVFEARAFVVVVAVGFKGFMSHRVQGLSLKHYFNFKPISRSLERKGIKVVRDREKSLGRKPWKKRHFY
jgi:hypothetical protein